MKAEKKDPPKTLQDLMKRIDKDFGPGTIMRGRSSIVNVSIVPTGIPSIDKALGAGGVPIGRTLEIFGPESSGKTTTCLHIASAFQKHFFKGKERNGVVAYIDAEHALDIEWARRLGVDTETLCISQPDSGEDAFRLIEVLVESGQVDLVVVDSVAALIPKAILEEDIGKATMGALAQLMSKALSKLKGKCNNSGTTLIFVNQLREKVGMVFGNPEVTPGGRALKYYASVRAEIKRSTAIKSSDDTVIGHHTTMKIIKNKVAAPFRVAEFDIFYGTKSYPIAGIDAVSSLLDVGLDVGVISKSGSFFSYDGKNLGNGAQNASKALRNDEVLFKKIKDEIYLKAFGPDFGQIKVDDELDDKYLDDEEDPNGK